MKKNFSVLLLAAMSYGSFSYAQQIEGKTPLSILHKSFEVPTKTIHIAPLNAEEIIRDLQSESNNNALAKLAETSISFPESGTIILAPDGMTRIWRVRVEMPQSMGLGFYFDKYQLPQGVEMFLYNENQRHIKGTYSNLENQEDKMFATGPVQGHIAYLELNIPPSVNIEDIELHVNEIASYFRGALPELSYYDDSGLPSDSVSVIGTYDNVFFKASSTCMINAKCSQGDGFENQRKATVHTLIMAGGYIYTCSGTMINKLDNAPGSCKPYLLTASHCEPDNMKSGARFTSQYILRFNNESPVCTNPPSAPNAKELTGVNFVARSNYDKSRSASEIKGDFLLLEPRAAINPTWDVVLNGWRANLPTISVSSPDKIIGFHHPGGDIKKVSYTRSISNYALGAAGTHWNIETIEGYAAQGSSGSGLFDKEGRLIGIASVSTGVGPSSCRTAADGSEAASTSTDLSYSKMSYCWTNPGDAGSDNNLKLKPWLDPANTGTMTANPAKSDCTPLTTSIDKINPFTSSMNVYPNPSQSGQFQLQLNVTTPAAHTITVYDITGKVISTVTYDNLASQTVMLDLSHVSNGVYMVQLSNESGSTTEKVTVAK